MLRKRTLLANQDLILGVRTLAKGVEPCLQYECSCGDSAIAPVPAAERGKPFSERSVLNALPEDERGAMAEFKAEHSGDGHSIESALVLMGI